MNVVHGVSDVLKHTSEGHHQVAMLETRVESADRYQNGDGEVRAL